MIPVQYFFVLSALNQNRQEVAQTQGLAKQIVDECCYYTKIKHNYLSISGITKSIAAPVVMRSAIF